MYTNDRKQSSSPAWQLAAQLVKIDSSDPGAYEGEIEGWIRTWILKRAKEHGILVKEESEPRSLLLKTEEVLPGRRNLMARIPGTLPGPVSGSW